MTIPHFWHNIDSEVALRVPLGPQVAVLTAKCTKCEPCDDLVSTRKGYKRGFWTQKGPAVQPYIDRTSAMRCREEPLTIKRCVFSGGKTNDSRFLA